METVNLSLRTVAAESWDFTRLSFAIVIRRTGLPSDDTLILKLAEVLQIDPPERRLSKAKRVPDLLPALLSAHKPSRRRI